MKLSHITQVNQKGQLVLPKTMRAQLGISPSTHLHVFLRGKSLIIQPITAISTLAESETSYLDILQKTRGSWAYETFEKDPTIELTASSKRKFAW